MVNDNPVPDADRLAVLEHNEVGKRVQYVMVEFASARMLPVHDFGSVFDSFCGEPSRCLRT